MGAALAGLRIVLTRGPEGCAEWAEPLAELGAEPIAYPCIAAETIDTPDLRAALADAVATADWLVLTSRRGAEAFAKLHGRPLAARTRVAVVGPATADAARKALGRADFVAAGGTAAALGAELGAALSAEPGAGLGAAVIAVAENAGPGLEAALTATGAACRRFNVYRTVPAEPREPKQSLAALRADRVVFASPSAVTGFLSCVAIDADFNPVAIGPSTSGALHAAGFAVAAEARVPGLDGIIDALVRSVQAESLDV